MSLQCSVTSAAAQCETSQVSASPYIQEIPATFSDSTRVNAQKITTLFHNFVSNKTEESFGALIQRVDDFSERYKGEYGVPPLVARIVRKIYDFLFDEKGFFEKYVSNEHLNTLLLLTPSKEYLFELAYTMFKDKTLLDVKRLLGTDPVYKTLSSLIQEFLPLAKTKEEEIHLILLSSQLWIKTRLSDTQDASLPNQLKALLVSVIRREESKEKAVSAMKATIEYFKELPQPRGSEQENGPIYKILVSLIAESALLQNGIFNDAAKDANCSNILLHFHPLQRDIDQGLLKNLLESSFQMMDSKIFLRLVESKISPKVIQDTLKSLYKDNSIYFFELIETLPETETGNKVFHFFMNTIEEDLQEKYQSLETLQKSLSLDPSLKVDTTSSPLPFLDILIENVTNLSLKTKGLRQTKLNALREVATHHAKEAITACVLYKYGANTSENCYTRVSFDFQSPFLWYSEFSKTCSGNPLILSLLQWKEELEKKDLSQQYLEKIIKQLITLSNPLYDTLYHFSLNVKKSLDSAEDYFSFQESDGETYQLPEFTGIQTEAKSLLAEALSRFQKPYIDTLISMGCFDFVYNEAILEGKYADIEKSPYFERFLNKACEDLDNDYIDSRRGALVFLFHLYKKGSLPETFFQNKNLTPPKLARMAYYAYYNDQKKFFSDLLRLRSSSLYEEYPNYFTIDSPENNCPTKSLIRMMDLHDVLPKGTPLMNPLNT